MKLYEVMEIALMYLGLNDEIKVQGGNRTPISNKKLKILLRCANVIYGEIASDYLGLKKKETLAVIEGKIAYQSFAQRVIDVIKVLKDGEKIDFTVYPNYLEVSGQGLVDVVYHYLPEDLTLDDEIAYGTGLSPVTFAAGIAGEYSLVNNMYDEAFAFEKKFREGLRAALTSGKSRHIKARRWI